MNRPAWLWGVTAVCLAITCLYLRSQLRAVSAEADAAADDALRAKLSELRAERDRLETDVRSLRAVQAGPGFAPQPSAAALAPASPSPSPGLVMRELPPSVHRTMLHISNGQLFKELGLSDAQKESLLDLLAAQAERARLARLNGEPGHSAEVRARNRAELAEVVGSEAAVKIDDWQQSFFARSELRTLREQLEGMGEPLSEAQQARITELMHSQPPPALPDRQPDEPPEAFAARFKSWRSESRDHRRALVTSVLEPRQLALYEELDEMSRSIDQAVPFVPGPSRVMPLAGQAAPVR